MNFNTRMMIARAKENRNYNKAAGMKFPLDDWVSNTTVAERVDIFNKFYSEHYGGKRRQKKRRKTGGMK